MRRVSAQVDFYTGKSGVIEVDDRRRVSLGKFGRHNRYLVHEQTDGTLILEPAVVLTEAEVALMSNNAHPERLRARARRS